MAFKPRIVITLTTETGKSELSIIKGRTMRDGQPAPGPTKKQIRIVQRCIQQLCEEA